MTMPKPTPFKIISDIVSKTTHPWEYEPDLYEWTHRGVECIARRNLTHGAWCGYADVPRAMWIKFNRNRFDTMIESIEQLITVHGGVTYDEYILDKNARRVGFDCAHGGDKMPKITANQKSYSIYGEVVITNEVYRDLAFVIAECESMVDQILEVTGGSTSN
jgi:hypothetical protein